MQYTLRTISGDEIRLTQDDYDLLIAELRKGEGYVELDSGLIIAVAGVETISPKV